MSRRVVERLSGGWWRDYPVWGSGCCGYAGAAEHQDALVRPAVPRAVVRCDAHIEVQVVDVEPRERDLDVAVGEAGVRAGFQQARLGHGSSALEIPTPVDFPNVTDVSFLQHNS